MTDERSTMLDLDNTIHADAFLMAAAHFLSRWPREWTAAELESVILTDDDESEEAVEKQKQLGVWQPIEAWCEDRWQLHTLIEDLALDMIDFLNLLKNKP